MASDQRGGRPRASSRETLAEAASELFLEKGFAETSVADITTRAGVSRSSFFNYFSTKSDVLWAGFDERIAELPAALARGGEPDLVVRRALVELAHEVAPDSLALALAQAEAMGLADELQREAAVRQARIGRAVAERLRAEGVAPLRADVLGAGYGGAVLAALASWAASGAGRTPLHAIVSLAVEAVAPAARVAAPGRSDDAAEGLTRTERPVAD